MHAYWHQYEIEPPFRGKIRHSSLVPRRSLLPPCPPKSGKERVRVLGESFSVASQLKVESRIDRAENSQGIGWRNSVKRKLICKGGLQSYSQKFGSFSFDVFKTKSSLKCSLIYITRQWEWSVKFISSCSILYCRELVQFNIILTRKHSPVTAHD